MTNIIPISLIPSCPVCIQEASSRCLGCRRVYYCSEEHQRQDWKSHKTLCKTEEDKTSEVWQHCREIIDQGNGVFRYCIVQRYMHDCKGFLYVSGALKIAYFTPLLKDAKMHNVFRVVRNEVVFRELFKVVNAIDLSKAFPVLYDNGPLTEQVIFTVGSEKYSELYHSIQLMNEELIEKCITYSENEKDQPN